MVLAEVEPGTQVSVVLSLDGRDVIGTAANGGSRNEAVAGATLDALAQLVPSLSGFALVSVDAKGAEYQPGGGAPPPLIVVLSDGARTLSGAALMRSNPMEASARAVLDALNRLIERETAA